jgi:hypothetical protein
MSLELAAQHLASRGRKGDTMLVHMAPQEVSGLQALAKAHGGTLTVNPDTGLPEANFLKRMLPMLIGMGLAPFTGGLSAALITGAGYTAATGSLKKGLMAGLGAYGGAGLMGGLSAAGTAAAGEGLAGAVNPLAGAAAETGLTATGGVMGTNPMLAQPMTFGAETSGVQVGAPIIDAPNLSQTGANLFGRPGAYYGPSSGAEAMTIGNSAVSPINAANIAPTVTPPPAAVAAPATPMSQTDFLSGMDRAALENKAVAGFNPTNTDAYTNAKRGLSGLMDNQASRDAFMTKMEGGTGLLKTGLMAAAPMLMGGQKSDPYTGGGPNPYEYSYDPNTQRYTRVAPGTRQRDIFAPTTSMMAMGGPVEDMSYQNRMDTMMANGSQMFATGGQINLQGTFDVGGGQGGSQMGGSNNPQPFVGNNNAPSMTQPAVMPQNHMFIGTPEPAVMPRGFQELSKGPMSQGIAFAKGGISHLGDYSDGGRLLKGPGDGVSDSIPATIANKRPARLADGEFVVPARIVSELGNGSTEAGARKLYAMMDRVQKARGKTTGKNRVAVNSRTEKLLPA